MVRRGVKIYEKEILCMCVCVCFIEFGFRFRFGTEMSGESK